MVYTLRFFPLQNAVCFIILTYLVPVLFTFFIQGVLKFKKNNSGAKRLIRNLILCTRHMILLKVQCSRYRPGVAQRGGRGIALLFLDRGTRRG